MIDSSVAVKGKLPINSSTFEPAAPSAGFFASALGCATSFFTGALTSFSSPSSLSSPDSSFTSSSSDSLFSSSSFGASLTFFVGTAMGMSSSSLSLSSSPSGDSGSGFFAAYIFLTRYSLPLLFSFLGVLFLLSFPLAVSLQFVQLVHLLLN